MFSRQNFNSTCRLDKEKDAWMHCEGNCIEPFTSKQLQQGLRLHNSFSLGSPGNSFTENKIPSTPII